MELRVAAASCIHILEQTAEARSSAFHYAKDSGNFGPFRFLLTGIFGTTPLEVVHFDRWDRSDRKFAVPF